MKKIHRIVLVFLILACLIGTPAIAAETGVNNNAPRGFLQLYDTEKNLSCALKFHLWRNIYAGTNIEYYSSEKDLKLHLGAIWLFPHDVLFFKFYGGGGYQYSRSDGKDFSYILLGSHFLFFFSEALYPWEIEAEPLMRFGLSFSY